MSLTLDHVKNQDIYFTIENQVGQILLNRPHALNALSVEMMASIRQTLIEWRENSQVECVIVRSACKRSFCAGGDLRGVYQAIHRQDFARLDYLFREEYALNHVIATYPKPYISFIDGITMGGGVGLCVHGSHRLMSEKALVAMPETNIGYFPDVGATAFLNRCPGSVGLYLGLTGLHMSYADALFARIGTHFIPSQSQNELANVLFNLPQKTPSALNEAIRSYAQPLPFSELEEHLGEINALFQASSVEQILKSLENSKTSFARKAHEMLMHRSPTSLSITFEQLKRGKDLTDFADVMRLEFDMSQNLVHSHDFFEGIRAAIIDKDRKPHWKPSNLSDVTPQALEGYFRKHPQPLEL